MELQSPTERPTYQHALRIIGRYLDAEPAYHVTVVEVENGFTVRFSPTRHRSEGRTSNFSWDRLQDLRVFNSAGRGVGMRRNRRTWQDVPGGYQDFFRALGAWLDDVRAVQVSLDALPGGMAVSYLMPDSSNPLEMSKVHSILGRDEMTEILSEAQQRRSPAAVYE